MRRAFATRNDRTTFNFAGTPSCENPACTRLKLSAPSKVPFDEVRQFEILEHHVEEFVLRQLEDEVVVAFAAI